MKADELKRTITIEDYFTRVLNVTPVKKGDGVLDVSPCPFCKHSDCFRISPSDQLFNCFSCNMSGDVISLHQKLKGLDFKDALKDLHEIYGLKYEEGKVSPVWKNTLLADAWSYYVGKGSNSAILKKYLEGRAVSEKQLKHYGLGVSDGKITSFLQEKKYKKQALLDSGLIREKDGKQYDLFGRNLVIFPYCDEAGNVQHFKARGIESKNIFQLSAKDSTPLFFNMNSKPVDDLYITEGEFDAIALEKTGLTAWATGGQLTGKKLAKLEKVIQSGVNVVFAFDNDEAGSKYLEKALDALKHFLLPPSLRKMQGNTGGVFRLSFPAEYKDVDEALRKMPGQTFIKEAQFSPLIHCIMLYRETVEKESHNALGRLIYDYFAGVGRFFVVDEACYLLYKAYQYQVDNNLPFKSLIYKETSINYADKSSKVIWEVLQASIYNNSPHVENSAWLYTNHLKQAIYFNLCNEANEIIKIEPDNISIMENGSNVDNVLLLKSPKTKPITFKKEIELGKNLRDVFCFFSEYLACSEESALYVICLTINTFFLQYSKAHGINRFSGTQGSGKTEGAGLVTTLLYGQNFVTIGSTASDYTDAALNPVTVCDNLEIHNITDDRRDFLLCVATGITRQKRKAGTDSKNIYEHALTQVITTSIESFELPELIERAIEVPFSKDYFCSKHPGPAFVEETLKERRDDFLSAFILLVSKMPNFQDRKNKFLAHIQEVFPRHSKKRLNEHFACLAAILEALLEHDILPSPQVNAYKVLDSWIATQESSTHEINEETNPIVRFLNMIEIEHQKGVLKAEYHLETVDGCPADEFAVEVTTDMLLLIFNQIAKKYGIKNPFKSVRHLGIRIANEKDVIEKAGWSITKSRTVKGKRYYILDFLGKVE